MVPSRTDLVGGRLASRPGARTGVGTYIHYLLAASVLVGSALAGALASARARRTEKPPASRSDDVPSTAEPPR